MIRLILMLLFCSTFTNSLYAQQWVEKKYQYDSIINIRYGTAANFAGESDSLFLDVFKPKCSNAVANSKFPLLVWVHGGSFLAGSKDDESIQLMCREFAKRGYVTASVGYRLGFVSDDNLWQCNFPDYNCVFAADSAEWGRAYFRAIQDVKGAIRFLVNRNDFYQIDVNNVFVAGESAGAFTALGVGLMDTIAERPAFANALNSLPIPNSGNLNCAYNVGKTFSNSIARPDLGTIEGYIEPSNIHYTIKGIGNMYGALMGDLLKHIPQNKPKPAIYSFHQSCDIVVPIDSNYVYWGLSWCFTNGYNCYGIANNKLMLYGSRTFSNWNTNNGYGYAIHNEFTNIDFPYNFLIGAGSCLDQANNPCHAYDNFNLRESNLANFFASFVSSAIPCDTATTSIQRLNSSGEISIFPNPVNSVCTIVYEGKDRIESVQVLNLLGQTVYKNRFVVGHKHTFNTAHLNSGIHLVKITLQNQQSVILRMVKE